ncbi:hypothetical protein FRACYDRAFT_236296 [Fragilariopsis cylindrus CCMP1102]|uniref:Uncharacterized protein n=1 Tax=Fragilariopsis cylindrus CCMP1102 TaxID=635003 RepID=A0A1E7FQ35_9STRA|nr:hypothetical protein FRACYDRAFT_236296 [Fragilariopsis cylindrus CCMP1102]|eukprot:OEU20224.1 hypothetical protein FRACYDRAFT_236296 [Fragilariopsis cylindrus CCMP1102]
MLRKQRSLSFIINLLGGYKLEGPTDTGTKGESWLVKTHLRGVLVGQDSFKSCQTIQTDHRICRKLSQLNAMNLSLLTSTTLVCFALCAEGVFGVTSYPNNPDSKPPTQWSSMENKFQQHCSPYGVSIFAKDWPRDKFLHACNMLAQLLDNDQDGCADDTNVVKTIRASQSGMALFPKDKDSNYDLIAETFNGQPLYVFETQLGCSGSNESRNCRDAAIEEIFHLVTQKGLSPAYKTDFAECDSKLNKISTMQKQMDIARGGHFVSVPKNYPDGSIYTYDVSFG